MLVELVVWLSAFFLIVALSAVVVYQLMCLMDLECDYINPYDLASRINSTIIPEFALQAVLCCIFLFSGHLVMFFICVPNLYYNLRMYQQRRHLIDVTEIFNHLSREKTCRIIKLVLYVLILFLSLFWMLYSIVEED